MFNKDTIKNSTTFRWFMFGLLTVLLDSLLFKMMHNFGLNAIASNYLSGIMSLIFNFNMNYFLVFTHKTTYLSALSRFLLSFIFERFFNTLQVLAFLSLGAEPLIAKLSASFIQSPISYYLNRKFVMKI